MLTKRPHYRPIPQGAEIITRGGQRYARWTNKRGQTLTRPLNDKGNRIVCDSLKWYSLIKDPTTGERLERKAYSDKIASAALDNELLVKIERGMQGLIDPMDEHRKRPIAEHLDAYEDHLTNKENSVGYVEQTMQRCRDIVAGIKATVICEITAGRVESYLADQRRGGMSMASSNHYLRAIKSFAGWLVKDRRAPDNPLAVLSALSLTEQDKKRRRRALTDAEVVALVNSATGSDRPFRGIPGADRAMLYNVALNTGLRASELASLTPGSFDLDGEPATVCCLGAYTKNGQQATLPLRPDLTAALKEWLDGRPAAVAMWPGRWASSRAAAEMIRRDLAAAKAAWVKQAPSEQVKVEREKSSFLEYRDASDRFADFHSLRHTFITNLARGKVHPKNAQALARHSTINLTMNAYTHTVLGDLADDVGKLPALPAPKAPEGEAGALGDTGTDGPLRPDDDPRRRTRRRTISDLACENSSNDGDTWRSGGDSEGGNAHAENTGKSKEMTVSGAPRLAVANAGGGSRTHTGFKPRRILNPVRLPIPPLRRLLLLRRIIRDFLRVHKGLHRFAVHRPSGYSSLRLAVNVEWPSRPCAGSPDAMNCVWGHLPRASPWGPPRGCPCHYAILNCYNGVYMTVRNSAPRSLAESSK